MQSSLPDSHVVKHTTESNFATPAREVVLTIVYEDRPSETVRGLSQTDETEAELDAFRTARDKRFLEGAKMLLVRRGGTTHAEFFAHSRAYRRFLDQA